MVTVIGIITGILLLATVVTGVKKAPLKVHKALAGLTLVGAIVHVFLIILQTV